MIAETSAIIESDGRVSRLREQPPLTLRQVQSDPTAATTLCLVGAAAGPLAGDDLRLVVEVRPRATVRLSSTGAALAQGRGDSGPPGRLRTFACVGDRGSLVATPPPLIVCAGSHTEVLVSIDLAAAASLDWRELLVLGRAGETGGQVRMEWDVRRGGAPLLRQSIDLTDPVAASWPGMLRGRRVLASELLVVRPEDSIRPVTIVLSPDAVSQQLDERSVLLTVLAADAATAAVDLAHLRAALTLPVAAGCDDGAQVQAPDQPAQDGCRRTPDSSK
jgi:urease accessory protein